LNEAEVINLTRLNKERIRKSQYPYKYIISKKQKLSLLYWKFRGTNKRLGIIGFRLIHSNKFKKEIVKIDSIAVLFGTVGSEFEAFSRRAYYDNFNFIW